MAFFLRFRILGCVLLIGLTGCSSSGRTTTTYEPSDGPSQEEILNALPSTETFDASLYPEAPPVIDVALEHEVPEELMTGEASAGALAQGGGYRIQLQFARDKASADQTVERVINWWNIMRSRYRDTQLFDGFAPVHNIYRQPYFRIRLGDYATKEEAEEMLAIVKEEFPGAFVVVDRVFE